MVHFSREILEGKRSKTCGSPIDSRRWLHCEMDLERLHIEPYAASDGALNGAADFPQGFSQPSSILSVAHISFDGAADVDCQPGCSGRECGFGRAVDPAPGS